MHSRVYGGAEYQVGLIAKACSEQGFECYYALEERTSEIKREIDLEKKDSRIVHMNLGTRSLIIAMILFYMKMFVFLMTHKINVAFIYEKYGILIIPLLKVFGLKIVYSERNSGEWIVKRFIYRLLLNRCVYLMCNSDYAYETMKKKLKPRIFKINNYINVPTDVDKRQSLMEKKHVSVLIPARISPEKNQKVVLQAMCEKPLGMNRNVDFVFAGKVDDDEYKRELDLFLQKMDTTSCSIQFLGFIEDKNLMYSKCDVVVLPSFSEGTPNVVLECFARKIPVIASNIPQNKILFENDDFLFDPNDSQSFLKAMDKMMSSSSSEIDEFVLRNHEFVKNNFGWASGPMKYVELFNSMIKKRIV